MKNPAQVYYELSDPPPSVPWEEASPAVKAESEKKSHDIYNAYIAVLNERSRVRVGTAVDISDDTPISDSFIIGCNPEHGSISICLKTRDKQIGSVLSLNAVGAFSIIEGLKKNLELVVSTATPNDLEELGAIVCKQAKWFRLRRDTLRGHICLLLDDEHGNAIAVLPLPGREAESLRRSLHEEISHKQKPRQRN